MPQAPVTIASARPSDPDACWLIEALDADLRDRYPGSVINGLTLEDLDNPRLLFLVARMGDRPVGCGAVRPIEPGVGEIKRMFVVADSRGRGIARRLLAALEAGPRARGLSILRLETGSHQPEAIGLYESSGYARIGPFGDYSHPKSVYFERRFS